VSADEPTISGAEAEAMVAAMDEGRWWEVRFNARQMVRQVVASEAREAQLREALQITELLIRPGAGQCDDVDIAHVVVRSLLDKNHIAALAETGSDPE
jgi:hypothetical protein